MNEREQDNPGVIAPPPLLYAGVLAIGLLVHRIVPVKFTAALPARLLGTACIGLGSLIIPAAFREMRRAKTNVNPSLPATAIVTEGPFRITRNPLYLSLALIYVGITLLVNSFWPILLFPFLIRAVNSGVINREERYLERKFGEEYLNYKNRVARWL